MSGYIPNTSAEQKSMLESIGIKDFEGLFDSVPENVRFKGELNLPAPLSEPELLKHMKSLASENTDIGSCACFLGAGSYDHFIPAAVRHIVSRSEFYTAYTPYQPEISQGTLQAIFEYQTMICELTGMDVSNASMYDGGTALAEAAFMAAGATGRKKILVSKAVHPEHRAVIKTYCRFKGLEMEEIGFSNGQTDASLLAGGLDGNTAAVVIQSPNFFGVIEDMASLGEAVHRNGSLFIVSPDPISLAILKSPAEAGADICAGEGQPLGGALNFGGPAFGFLAAKKELLRKMPGRIVGETVDRNGKRCFVLTIQAREQHIRREKATSNICSNQGLNALTATVYLSLMGKSGLSEAAGLCLSKARYTYERLLDTGKFRPLFNAPFFKEFALESLIPVQKLNEALLQENIMGGYDLSKDYPEITGGYLLAVTEKRTRAEIDKLVSVVKTIKE